jgi:outer membrane protein assembly factor BamB
MKWSVKGQSNSSNPLVHDGLVFETFGLEYAWNATTGDKILFKGKSLRNSTKDSLIHFSSSRGVAIVNIYNGQLIYQSRKMIKRPWIEHPRVIRGRYPFIALNDSAFALLNVADGAVKWRRSLKGIYNAPVMNEDAVYISDSKCIYALNKDTGAELWKSDIGAVASDPLIIDNVLYVMTATKGLVALDVKARKIVWEFKPAQISRNHQIHIDGDSIFLSGLNLYALSRTTGKLLWQNTAIEISENFVLTTTSKYILVYKIVDDYQLLVACSKTDGRIAFEGFSTVYDSVKEPALSRPLSQFEGRHFRFADSMYKGCLYATDPRGNIYCFQVKE